MATVRGCDKQMERDSQEIFVLRVPESAENWIYTSSPTNSRRRCGFIWGSGTQILCKDCAIKQGVLW